MKTPRLIVALLALAAALLAACGTGSGGSKKDSSAPAQPGSSAPVSGSSTPSGATSSDDSGPKTTVKVTSVLGDGATVGIGMPVILRFTPSPTDSSAFTKAAKVTVNGQPASGAWYWEQPYKGQPIEAHYRMKTYWPGHATVNVELPIGGLSAGKGLVYSDKLTSITFKTGAAHISTVDGAGNDLRMKVTSDGKLVKTIPVSLGKAKTPTYTGVKVVMQKGENVPGSEKLRPRGAVIMKGPGYGPELVDWSVRVTASGEYVHAAPWNSRIGQTSTSNGCTNLSVADAQWFYGFSLVGDVVTYSNTGGTKMPSWDGYGDWNLPWGTWAQGGLLLNH